MADATTRWSSARSGCAGGGELELALEDGQRGAQLVAGVGDEGPLAPARLRHPPEHLVEGGAQPADLVVRLGQRQAGVGVGGRDRRRAGAHRLHGPQGAGGQRVARRGREEQRERAADEQRAREHVERVLALGKLGADDDHAPGGADGLGEHPQALAAIAHDPPALCVAPLAGDQERPRRRRRRRHDPPAGVEHLGHVADLPGGQGRRAQQRGRVAGARDRGDVVGAHGQRVVDAVVDPRLRVQVQEAAHDGEDDGHDARVDERQTHPQRECVQSPSDGAHSR